MIDETMKYIPRIAIRNYGIVFALLAVSTIFLRLSGEPWEQVLLKLPVIPLFYLAMKGIFVLYKKPIYERKITLRSFECSTLQAVISALTVSIWIWQADLSAMDILKKTGSIFVMFFLLHMVMLIIRTYRISKGHEKPE